MRQIEPDTQVAIITGAAGGIGQCIAGQLHRLGYRLFLVDRKQEVLEEMQRLYPSSLIEVIDLQNKVALEGLCQRIESFEQDIAIAIINAGIIIPGNLSDLKRDQLDEQLDINLNSALHLNHACTLKMKTQCSGHIINTASMASLIALKGSAIYSATKFGLRGFLIALRSELRQDNIHISIIYPSGVDTPLLRYEALNSGSALNFLNAPSSAEDVAEAMLKALDNKGFEYYVPYTDSIGARLACIFPKIMDRLYPMLEYLGEKGRKKFIQSRNLTK